MKVEISTETSDSSEVGEFYMLIGIDGNEANVKNRVGSNRYAFDLLWAMHKLQSCRAAELQSQDTPGVGAMPVKKPPFEPYTNSIEKAKSKVRRESTLPEWRDKVSIVVCLKEKPLPDLPKETDWWQYRVVGPRRFWTQFGLPLDLYLHQPRPDVFFTPGHYLPRWCSCPAVMAILDVAYIHFPEMFKKRDLWQLRRWTEYSVKKAKKILTISESTRNDIINYYQLPLEKVVVTYPGFKIDSKHLGGDEATTSTPARWMEKTMKKYGIKGDFILYVGTLQPRKNLLNLIEAHNILISPVLDRPGSGQYPNLSLVIVGKKGWLYDEIFKKVKDLGLEKKVIFTGYVPGEDLPAFYQQAQCFVLISLYEGFGLPILEAMHYGCPVVASNASSLPEVMGRAGVLVDPNNVEEIAAGIQKAIKNRKELIKKGHQQARKFSWSKCARETLAILEEVGSRK